MSHTYAILRLSREAFDEIEGRLLKAGYEDQIHEEDGVVLIDMHGIALQAMDQGEPP